MSLRGALRYRVWHRTGVWIHKHIRRNEIVVDDLLSSSLIYKYAKCGMGIDRVAGGRSKKPRRTAPKSDDVYLKPLVKLYRFLVRRTGSKFNAVIMKRLFMSKINRPPISLNRLIEFMEGKDNKIAVIDATVTDDEEILTCPQ
ncbi:60S ribosomal protein L18-2 [Canna indica]|uniref:60S ribosomal protein L18-2 n=1 Tax=Canna indica TaxID=4628 RepID=A0AAQ3KXK6_9LILI|nr:60S ribosomal protein L18-2 [Canna indica]